MVFVNCSNDYAKVLKDNIADFVAKGGWLVSSDWSLHYIIEKAFPGLVKWTGKTTGDEIIAVEPDLQSLWSEIVVLGADPQWWLWGSYPIQVLDREQVKIEAASHDLLRRYQTPVVAVRFAWEQGHVFHVISHFWAKRSDTPTVTHSKPYTAFLKEGMRLSEDGVNQVMRDSKIGEDTVSFAMLQSAATATELVAQLCVQATTTD